jgi:hypothetical protein
MSTNPESVCSNPSCGKPGSMLCANCADAQYCSKECQKAHWAAHKTLCKTKSIPRTVDRLKETDLRTLLIAKAETFDNKVKKNTLLNKAENPKEKVEALRTLAKEHVGDAEVEGLLAAAKAKQKKRDERVTTTAIKQTAGKTIKPPSHFQPGTPSPDQLRQQANMMRQNPAAVRKAQPAFATLTDEQIRAYADQLEQTANDPNMMKEVERMSQLGDDDRKLVSNIQQGLSGGMPITDEWITDIVMAIKTKPDLFKTMFGGKGAFIGGTFISYCCYSHCCLLDGLTDTSSLQRCCVCRRRVGRSDQLIHRHGQWYESDAVENDCLRYLVYVQGCQASGRGVQFCGQVHVG